MTKHITDEQLAHWFAYHTPSSQEIIDAHAEIRLSFRELALRLNNLLPEGPDKTVALRALQTAMMQANMCIALAQKLYSEE